MKATKKMFIAVSAVALVATVAFAAVIGTETISYPDGDLVGQGTWAAYSSAGSKPLQVVGQQARVVQSPDSGEDIYFSFDSVPDATATTYACFEVTVPSTAPLGTAVIDTPIYFAGFKQPANFFLFARTWVAPHAEGDFTFGLSSGGTIEQTWPDALSFDVTYKVAIKYNAADGSSELWVDPVDQNSASIVDAEGFAEDLAGEFFLRQNTGGGGIGASSYQMVDNVKAATTFHEACDTPVQAQSSTWGHVKGIYR